jgi:hypothetical protein
MSGSKGVRSLVLVLGDQLDAESSALDGFDPKCDVIWMAEVAAESEHVCGQASRGSRCSSRRCGIFGMHRKN